MGAWGIKALARDEGLDVLDILKTEYVPEHPVMEDVYKRQSQGKNKSGIHAESVVHRAGEGVPQPNSGIRRRQHDRRKQNLHHPSHTE